MAFKKIKEKILDNSDMYNFYKEEYLTRSKKIEEMERLIQTHQDFLNHIFIFYNLKPNTFTINIRNLSYEFLKFFDNICQKYEIEYWMDYGTLLGAVRHRSFIPWDDDLDVGMMRGDYNKFLEIFPQEIENQELINIDSDFKIARYNKKSERWFQFSYRLPEYKDKFIGIDIFPYDYIKDDEYLEDKYTNYIKNYYKNPDTIGLDTFIDDFYKEFNVSLEKQDYIISGVEGIRGNCNLFTYPYKVLNSEDIFPLQKIMFGSYDFLAPNDTAKYLKGIYGKNFRRIPKEFKDHGRLNRFRKQENINQKLEDAYKIFKKINENFK